MAIYLYRLGCWCATHIWRVIAGWAVIALAIGGAAVTLGNEPTPRITMPGTQFQEVLKELKNTIPSAAGGFGTVVFTTDADEFSAAQKAAIDRTATSWTELDYVTAVTNPFTIETQMKASAKQLAEGADQLAQGKVALTEAKATLDAAQAKLTPIKKQLTMLAAANPNDPRIPAITAQIQAAEEKLKPGFVQYEKNLAKWEAANQELTAGKALQVASAGIRFISEDGKVAVAQIQFTENPQNLSKEFRDQIPALGQDLSEAGIQAHYSAEIAQSMNLMGMGEVIGLIIAALVLIIMLGTLVAAGLPILMALVGVGVGLAAAVATTVFYDMNTMTPSLALMLGLAVGIDYTLFIINRHRTQVLNGMPVVESIGRALGTAGSAVIFAGLTVVIALAALVISQIPILSQMGLVAAATVAITVFVSMTLTPAFLGLIGTRLVSRKAWAKADAAQASADESVDVTEPTDDTHGAYSPAHGDWFVRATTKAPWLTVLVVTAAIAVLAIPVSDLRLGLPDGGSEPKDSTAFKAYTAVDENFGPGMNGPIVAMATFPDELTSVVAKQAELMQEFKSVSGVSAAVPFGVSTDKKTLAFQVVPTTGPAEAATVTTVHALQSAAAQISADSGARIGITGQTVANIEISEKLRKALPPYLAVVVGLSLLILLGVFRSLLVPLIATGGFLLSVAAAFGGMVAVYQWGWLAAIFDVGQPGPVMSFAPIIVIGVLFGLAMDYQMFLVTGMREHFVHGQSARAAVRSGFTHGAKVVTAAAIIMFAVFGGFVFAHMTMVRPIGFGLALGVLVDAVVVRMTLTPAVMHILGEKAWWLPKWLDKVTPQLDVEGAQLATALAGSGGAAGVASVAHAQGEAGTEPDVAVDNQDEDHTELGEDVVAAEEIALVDDVDHDDSASDVDNEDDESDSDEPDSDEPDSDESDEDDESESSEKDAT